MGLQPSASRTVRIYLVTCTVNGKAYVGQTVQTLKNRWRSHVSYALRGGDRMALARAIRRHGAAAFHVRVLQEAPACEADAVEIAWIERLNCRVPHGYNLRAGGNRSTPHEITRAKVGRALSRFWRSLPLEERRRRVAKMHAAMTPEARSERSRRNASMRMTAEQHRARIQKANAAITHETRVAAGRAGWANQSKTQRATRIENIRSSLSHDQRRAMALRAWNTRGRRCTVVDVARAVEMRAQGRSLSAIARALGIARQTVTAALKREGRY